MLWLTSAINPSPERSHGAGAADHVGVAIDERDVAGGWVGISGHVGNATSDIVVWDWLKAARWPLLWQLGSGKTSLMPPPVAPSLFASSFHTVSLLMLLPEATNFVPPQASTLGLEAGKSTWFSPSVTPSVEPSSPAATQTVTPMAAAAWNASSMEVMACCVQEDSGPPQLMETIDGLLVLSCTAVVIAFRKPASVLSAK